MAVFFVERTVRAGTGRAVRAPTADDTLRRVDILLVSHATRIAERQPAVQLPKARLTAWATVTGSIGFAR
jgi:hypothetical protein